MNHPPVHSLLFKGCIKCQRLQQQAGPDPQLGNDETCFKFKCVIKFRVQPAAVEYTKSFEYIFIHMHYLESLKPQFLLFASLHSLVSSVNSEIT